MCSLISSTFLASVDIELIFTPAAFWDMDARLILALFVEGLAFSLECMESKSIEEVGEREEIVESTPIVTLDGTSYISGEFGGSTSLLGGNRVHGNISEDDYYTVMTADGNGGYKKIRYLASEVTVLFDSSKEDARVEKIAIIKDKKVTYMSSSSLLFESPIEFPYGQECTTNANDRQVDESSDMLFDFRVPFTGI